MKYILLFVLLTGCAYRATVEWQWGHEDCVKKEISERKEKW